MKLQPKTYNLKPHLGFTLIEAVVATALFAFVMSSIIGVYLSAIQIDRKTRSLRAVTQSARFITEYLTKGIRNGTINYASYPSGTVPATTKDLYFKNEAGQVEHIYPTNSTCAPVCIPPVACTVLLPCDLKLTKDASSAVNLNSSKVKVTGYRIYVLPSTDPFDAIISANENEQPRITVVLQLSSVSNGPSDSAVINLQTTIGSRVYPAKP